MPLLESPVTLIEAFGSRRWDSPPKIRFAPDSPLEGAGFEPSVPLGKLVRPWPGASRRRALPPAEPMVRIRLPPAASLRTFGPSAEDAGFISRLECHSSDSKIDRPGIGILSRTSPRICDDVATTESP